MNADSVERMRASLGWIVRSRDPVLAAGLATYMLVETTVASYVDHRPASALAVLALAVPLAVRRRFPVRGFVVTLAGSGALSLLSPDFSNNSAAYFFCLIFALYSVGANTAGRDALVATAIVAALAVWFLFHDGDSFHPGDIVFAAFVIGGPFAAGVAMRIRRGREHRLTRRTVELEREREARARAAVAEERRRIARELHDVVAHAISVTVVQARGGRKVLDSDLDTARAAFDSIERTGEQALGEMRRLLGMLREDDGEHLRAPQPSLARLDALAEDVRASGLPVEIEVDGETVELAPGVDLAAYRIVQEALTNTLKHAGPALARVRVRYAPDAVELTIEDDGKGPGSTNGVGTGNGLTGIGERVAVVGGAIETGPRPEGGFRVHAVLPYGDEA
ncbi:MAG TPA: histidine kinase [Gaiellaceae bacterium]|nr:histidine kinase [Gaiellaceae bacterium]